MPAPSTHTHIRIPAYPHIHIHTYRDQQKPDVLISGPGQHLGRLLQNTAAQLQKVTRTMGPSISVPSPVATRARKCCRDKPLQALHSHAIGSTCSSATCHAQHWWMGKAKTAPQGCWCARGQARTPIRWELQAPRCSRQSTAAPGITLGANPSSDSKPHPAYHKHARNIR